MGGGGGGGGANDEREGEREEEEEEEEEAGKFNEEIKETERREKGWKWGGGHNEMRERETGERERRDGRERGGERVVGGHPSDETREKVVLGR